MIGVGQLGYARIEDGIVFVFGCEGDRYQTIRINSDEEHEYFASDLTLWSPRNGDQVTETGNEDGPVGIVVEAGEEISLVVWKGLLRQVSWINSCLEPAWLN